MKIFILDDDYKYINLLKEKIDNKFKDVSYCEDCNQKCDIYFIDIDLDGTNGIEIARNIKDKYKEALIVFVSHREDLIFDALQVFPY